MPPGARVENVSAFKWCVRIRLHPRSQGVVAFIWFVSVFDLKFFKTYMAEVPLHQNEGCSERSNLSEHAGSQTGVFCRCFYSWRAGWTHHASACLLLRTWEGQQWVRAEGAPQLGAHSLGPPAELRLTQPAPLGASASRPCGGGGFRCQRPPVLSRAAPLCPAFCFCSGMPWERRGEGGGRGRGRLFPSNYQRA